MVLPLCLSLVDFVTAIRAGRKGECTKIDRTVSEWDFSILVPIFGDLSYLKNLDFLAGYGAKVVLCTTSRESEEFDRSIDDLAAKHRFRVFRSEIPLSTVRDRPTPWKLFYRTLSGESTRINKETARDEIIRDSFSVVDSAYCVFIDADTVSDVRLELLVGNFAACDYDLASVRVVASSSRTVMEKLQAMEYQIAMDARRIYPWLTSGAAMVSKTPVMRHIMEHHSLFFSGGDIEIGKLAVALGYKIGHIPFAFSTEVPSSLPRWFRQRMLWFGGGFRHSLVNFGRVVWRCPFHFVYFSIVVWALAPLRLYSMVMYPLILPMVYALYLVFALVVRWRERSWIFLLYPAYALLQVCVVLPFGPITYLRMAWHGRNPGMIRLRGDAEEKRAGSRPSSVSPVPWGFRAAAAAPRGSIIVLPRDTPADRLSELQRMYADRPDIEIVIDRRCDDWHTADGNWGGVLHARRKEDRLWRAGSPVPVGRVDGQRSHPDAAVVEWGWDAGRLVAGGAASACSGSDGVGIAYGASDGGPVDSRIEEAPARVPALASVAVSKSAGA